MKRAILPAAILFLSAASASAQELQPPGTIPPGAPGSPTPPPPGSPPATSNADDESSDSGLGLEWVWLNADAGYSYVNMTSFSESQLALVETKGSGPVLGAALGIRLFFLTIGARARNASLSSLGSLWELDGEAAFHMRVWRIDPYFGVRGGYAWIGSFDQKSVNVATGSQTSDVAVHGWNVGPMIGLDIYFTSLISLGAEVGGEFLFLKRPQVTKPPIPSNLPPDQQAAIQQQIQSNPIYQNEGSSVGFGAAGTAHLGIHF